MGKFSSFAELEQEFVQGKDYLIHHRHGSSGYAIVAPHGGWLERGTRQIADAIADEEHHYYCFDVLNRSQRRAFHIFSNKFDEPVCVKLVTASKTTITIHGAKGAEIAVYGGGLDVSLRESILAAINTMGIHALPDPSPTRQGIGKHNICNRCDNKMGVQLELTVGLRKALFSQDNDGNWQTNELCGEFVNAIRQVLI